MYKMLFGKRKKFEVNTAEVTYKVHYLGNVLTSMMKGEGCVDRPVTTLWENHVRCNGASGLKMNLTLTQGGLRVDTAESGVTHYYGHRIHYLIAHPIHPKLFVWVYQHVGKNLKTELRCHAVLCRRATHAKLIAFVLGERLERTLVEYKREKRRQQNARLLKTQVPLRTKTLSTTNKYKPSVQHSMYSAPKLGDLIEEDEFEEEEEQDLKEISVYEETLDEVWVNLGERDESEEEVYDNLQRVVEVVSEERICGETSRSSSISDSGIESSATNKSDESTLLDSLSILTLNNNNESYTQVSYEYLDDLSRSKLVLEASSPFYKTSSMRLKNAFKSLRSGSSDGEDVLALRRSSKSSSFSARTSLNKFREQMDLGKEKEMKSVVTSAKKQGLDEFATLA